MLWSVSAKDLSGLSKPLELSICFFCFAPSAYTRSSLQPPSFLVTTFSASCIASKRNSSPLERGKGEPPDALGRQEGISSSKTASPESKIGSVEAANLLVVGRREGRRLSHVAHQSVSIFPLLFFCSCIAKKNLKALRFWTFPRGSERCSKAAPSERLAKTASFHYLPFARNVSELFSNVIQASAHTPTNQSQ